MGLFDLFKKKEKPPEQPAFDRIAANRMVIDELQKKLEAMGYTVEKSPQYFSLTVNKILEIATVILEEPGIHPHLMPLMMISIHKRLFPDGIEENVPGVGVTLEEKIESAVDNYLNTTFPAIIESFSDTHHHELDFYSTVNGREILWHPKTGGLALQGEWKTEPTDKELLLNLVKEKLKAVMPDNKMNWLKLYIAKQPNGEIYTDCRLNNNEWQEGTGILIKYAKEQLPANSFLGVKQFVMIRRCDKYDA